MNRTKQTADGGLSRLTLRDKSLDYRVRYLFGDRFEVTHKSTRLPYFVKCVYFDGEFLARCSCPDKVYNRAERCKHEEAVIRSERYRVASAQFN